MRARDPSEAANDIGGRTALIMSISKVVLIEFRLAGLGSLLAWLHRSSNDFPLMMKQAMVQRGGTLCLLINQAERKKLRHLLPRRRCFYVLQRYIQEFERICH